MFRVCSEVVLLKCHSIISRVAWVLFANGLRNIEYVLKMFRAHLQDVSAEPKRYRKAICGMFTSHLSTTLGCLNTIDRLFFYTTQVFEHCNDIA